MKGVVRYALNHLSRPTIQRIAGVVVPLVGVAWVGRKVECPVCGGRFRGFLSYGYVSSRGGALCPRCMSLERHRLLWLWLRRQSNLFESHPRLLHVAPEHCYIKRFERLLSDHYVTADLESPLAKVKLDVQDMPFGDEEFDVVICNHILEHVDDDRRALAELRRVLRSGGWGILLSPVDYGVEHTLEDPSVTSAEERRIVFGQPDHLRLFGRDYPERLRSAGFRVSEIRAQDFLSADEISRYGIATDRIYHVVKE